MRAVLWLALFDVLVFFFVFAASHTVVFNDINSLAESKTPKHFGNESDSKLVYNGAINCICTSVICYVDKNPVCVLC